MRNGLGVFLFAVGFAVFLHVLVGAIGDIAYVEPFNHSGTMKAALICLGMIVVARLLMGESSLPTRMLAYYIIAFGGLRLLALPVSHTDFRNWATVDFLLFVPGVVLLASALGWAYWVRSRRTA